MTVVERSRPPLPLWDYLYRGMLHELGIPALVASLVLFVCAMTLLGANVSEMRAGYGRVQRSNEALLQLAMVNSDILRVEMTVRGYALSGDDSYLHWLEESRGNLRARLAALEKQVSYDSEQRADVAILKNLVAAHGAYFEKMARRFATDRERVVAEMVDYSKKVKRQPIEGMLAHMRAGQMHLLAEQQHEAEQRVISAYRYAICISSLALLLGAIGFAMVLHDRRNERRSLR